MKILLDTCVWGKARQILQDAGHDVIWAGDWPEDPGDEEILVRSQNEQRILVTLDKDFGELAIVKNQPHAGIIRLVNISASQQPSTCLQVLTLYKKQLETGAIITVQPGKVRVRLPFQLH